MTGIIHPEERKQVDVLEAYYWDHPDAQYRIVFADGEEYIRIFSRHSKVIMLASLGLRWMIPNTMNSSSLRLRL
ncbi:hypothetical protein [Actinotignum sp. GS-2025e]|uniref:hypothetical protein n=1 Tax=Actinotignum sp. GS-2025e TaxID=3427278 RepID=UPI003F4656BC